MMPLVGGRESSDLYLKTTAKTSVLLEMCLPSGRMHV